MTRTRVHQPPDRRPDERDCFASEIRARIIVWQFVRSALERGQVVALREEKIEALLGIKRLPSALDRTQSFPASV
jgi:hypothetical protein